jgi:hypothetical protein
VYAAGERRRMRAKIGLPALTAAGAAGFEVGREKGIEASRLGPGPSHRSSHCSAARNTRWSQLQRGTCASLTCSCGWPPGSVRQRQKCSRGRAGPGFFFPLHSRAVLDQFHRLINPLLNQPASRNRLKTGFLGSGWNRKLLSL